MLNLKNLISRETRRKTLFAFVLCFLFFEANAQTVPAGKKDTSRRDLITKITSHDLTSADSARLGIRPGAKIKIDTIRVNFTDKGLLSRNQRLDSLDLALKSCDFEKSANAMVLYDLGQMSGAQMGLRVERHKRIKIFNETGKASGTIKIEYNNQYGDIQIDQVAGQTINAANGRISYSDLDPQYVYREVLDKYHGMVVIPMPDVKAGSVVEIAYVWRRSNSSVIPGWDFQGDIPTRYSQYVAQVYSDVYFNSLEGTTLPLRQDSSISMGHGHVWSMENVPSFSQEPFSRSPTDGLQSIQLAIVSIRSPYGPAVDVAGSWQTIGKRIAENEQFSKTFDQNINDREGLAKQARKLPSGDAKIEFLFDKVRDLMKWNGDRVWASKEGIKKAWENKSGNWGEINMALCKLLNEADVRAYPMLASTRDNGKMYTNFFNMYQINKLVVYVPINDKQFYVLDASGKYNNFNEVPFDLLYSLGLVIDKKPGDYKVEYLKNDSTVKQEVNINAEIKTDGTMAGDAAITSFSYNKSNALQMHNLLDEKKYNEILAENNNDLKILSLKLENAEADSLPLVQHVNFKLDLPGADGTYIYFCPNLFAGLQKNPFVNVKRLSDVDFGCRYGYTINGKFKIPIGYRIESLPKAETITMPNKSITFQRTLIVQDGFIVARYVVNFKQSYFPQPGYHDIYEFFKKLDNGLNEQIVLKKAG